MVFAIKKFAGEPIYILSIDLPLDSHAETIRNINATFSRIASEAEAPLYILIDARSLAPTFSDILIGLDLQKSIPTEWARGSHARFLLIGEHPMLQIGCKRAKEYLNIDIAWHKTLEDALAHIRSETSYRAASADTGDMA